MTDTPLAGLSYVELVERREVALPRRNELRDELQVAQAELDLIDAALLAYYQNAFG